MYLYCNVKNMRYRSRNTPPNINEGLEYIASPYYFPQNSTCSRCTNNTSNQTEIALK